MDWKVMSKCILLIVVITLLIVTDSVVTQNVSQTSISDAVTPVDLSDVDHHSVRLRHRRQTQPIPLSEEQKNEIVDRHNVLRSHEGSSNMERLTWHTFLEKTAESWAAKCKWWHGETEHGGNARYKTVGQNLYLGTDVHNVINLTFAIQLWYDEKHDFIYDTSECTGKMCGHYTALVWATSREVGCALHQCEPLMGKEPKTQREIVKYEKALYLVCNYGPAGNLANAATGKLLKPFIKGKFCSNCRSGAGWCTHGLCNSECSSPAPDCNCSAICYNCATLNKETCRCNCAAGWHGPDCSERCVDKNKKCDPSPGTAGWPPYFCDKYEYVKKDCLVMCKLCTPNPDAVEGACPPVYGPHADKSASTSLMKSHHVMMMMFVMITTITVSISNRDAAV